MSGFTVDFEFEIGELLWMKGSHDQRGIVTDRIAQQCSGGIQKLYSLSRLSGFISEIALTREPPELGAYWGKPRHQEKESNASTTDNT